MVYRHSLTAGIGVTTLLIVIGFSTSFPRSLVAQVGPDATVTSQVNDDEFMSTAAAELAKAGKALEKAADAFDSAAEATESANQPDSSKFNALIAGLSIFVLAVFVGFEVITKVPPTLHTPLMSGSNAISGITLVGALLVAGRGDYASALGVLAVVFAMINVIGGFWVTHRMLSMFKR